MANRVYRENEEYWCIKKKALTRLFLFVYKKGLSVQAEGSEKILLVCPLVIA